MKCTQAQSLMHAFLNHSISDDQLGPFLDHIESCADCREELDLYSAVFDTLSMEKEDASGRLHTRPMELREKIAASRSYLRRKRTGRILPRVLIVVLAAAFLILFYVTVLHERIKNAGLFEPLTVETEAEPETGTEAGSETETEVQR